jgi:serine/threonine-protein kinase
MGEVYRARDSQLGREVALKLLPDSVTDDPERLARFEREARVLASLHHPRIATLFGFQRAAVQLPPPPDTTATEGDAGQALVRETAPEGAVGPAVELSSSRPEVPFLVMELVEGETLADRITRGPLPATEAIRVFDAIAEGLKIAHESGVVHRDLKPANIKLDAEGEPKILDFGLARVADDASVAGSHSASLSPTLTAAATMAGTLLGTAAYMAPEQARGKQADRRADLWAFGCCLWEALTGKRPFDGEDISLTLAAVLSQEPDWQRLPEDLPAPLEQLLHRCLVKEPRERLQDAGEAHWWLTEAAVAPPSSTVLPAPARRAKAGLLVGVAIAALAIGGAAGWLAAARETNGVKSAVAPDENVVRFRVEGASADYFGAVIRGRNLSVHPSGNAFAYRVLSAEDDSIHQHDLGTGTSKPIAGTENGWDPFYSDDGLWLGFARDGQLFKVPVTGGLAQRLAPLPKGGTAGFDWAGGKIVQAVWQGDWGLWVVPEGGGEPTLVPGTEGSSAQPGALYPHFVAGGRAIVFGGNGGATVQKLSIVDLESGIVRDLGVEGRGPQVLDSGHLVFTRDNGLWTVDFDLETLSAIGEARPFLALEQTSRTNVTFAASRNGTLVTIEARKLDLIEISFDGTRRRLDAQAGLLRHPRWSPDGSTIAYTRGGVGLAKVWLHDVASGREQRLSRQANDVFPVWTRDGRVVVFAPQGTERILGSVGAASSGEFTNEIHLLSLDRPDEPTMIYRGEYAAIPTTVSPDGIVLFETRESREVDQAGVYRIDLAQPGSAEPWLEEEDNGLPGLITANAAFSPDGRWVAFEAPEEGGSRVWVRSFPGPGRALPVSIGEARQPVFAPDGSRLFFASDRGIEAVDVATRNGEIEFGTSRVVLDLLVEPGYRTYDPHPDGRRLITVDAAEGRSGFGVVLKLGRALEDLDTGEG